MASRLRAAHRMKDLVLVGRTVSERTPDGFLEHPMRRGLVVCLAEDDPYWPGLDCAASRHVQRAAGGALHMPAGGAVQPGPVGIVLGQADHQAPAHRVFEETIRGALAHSATDKNEIFHTVCRAQARSHAFTLDPVYPHKRTTA
ncbi:hypothetical protein LJG11_28740 [Pseudomonas aeruginosa]|nr:hypothetical protein [Pseudomonas aeruginosa]MCC0234071.1 hypothetical protein [Pseudomonas aeruginosa]